LNLGPLAVLGASACSLAGFILYLSAGLGWTTVTIFASIFSVSAATHFVFTYFTRSKALLYVGCVETITLLIVLGTDFGPIAISGPASATLTVVVFVLLVHALFTSLDHYVSASTSP
jgi:hypothetical protein